MPVNCLNWRPWVAHCSETFKKKKPRGDDLSVFGLGWGRQYCRPSLWKYNWYRFEIQLVTTKESIRRRDPNDYSDMRWLVWSALLCLRDIHQCYCTQVPFIYHSKLHPSVPQSNSAKCQPPVCIIAFKESNDGTELSRFLHFRRGQIKFHTWMMIYFFLILNYFIRGPIVYCIQIFWK